MIEQGISLKVVLEILGHFSVSITGDIYGHVSPTSPRRRWTLSGMLSMGERWSKKVAKAAPGRHKGRLGWLRNGL